MTEEQFWHSNPRKIAVWEEAHKVKVNEINRLMFINGLYTLNATRVSVEQCLIGRKSRSKYYEEPIQIYEKSEKEKAIDEEIALNRLIGFFNGMEADAKAKAEKEVT